MKNIALSLAAVVMVFVLAGCRQRGVEVSFDATLPVLNEEEQNQDGSKTYFIGERYVFWEGTDSTAICTASGNSFSGTEDQKCSLSSGVGSRDGKFRLFVGDGDDPSAFGATVALFPAVSEKPSAGKGGKPFSNSISYAGGGFTFQCFLADKQYYRPNFDMGENANSDLTFSKKALPMVAYCASGQPRLRFYTPCGLIRLQLFSTSTASKGFKKIKTITLTCDHTNEGVATNISGEFSVRDYNTMDPTLIPETDDPEDKKITYDCGEGVLIDNDIKSFYIVLPYVDGSDNNRTLYNLTVEFTNEDEATLTGHVTTRVARNTITKIPAIDVKTKAISIVGNGTQLRPFQIYDVEDLRKVQAAFNKENPEINGVSLKPDQDSVYFTLSRGDITLTTVNWTSGIKFNNKCVFYGGENTITNNSANPIFATNDGAIRHLYVDGVCSAKSPLCEENLSDGQISLCHSNATDNATLDFAGICYSNEGYIHRCDYGILLGTSTVSGIRDISGICHENSGTIEECFCDCTLNDVGGDVSGICNNNSGTINSCYISKGLVGDMTYGICKTNSGTLTRCHTHLGFSLVADKESAGLCGNNSGTIDLCYNLSNVVGENNAASGLVINNASNSKLYNTYNEGNVSSTFGNVSGMVVTNSGELKNGYNQGEIRTEDVNGNAFAAGIVGSTAGTVANCYNTGVVTCENNHTDDPVSTADSGDFSTCYYLYEEGVIESTHNYAIGYTDTEMKDGTLLNSLNNWVSGDDFRGWNAGNPYPALDM